MPRAVADRSHWQYDTFTAVFRDNTIPDAFVTFALDETGAIDTMRLAPTSDLADLSFDYRDLLFRPVQSSR